MVRNTESTKLSWPQMLLTVKLSNWKMAWAKIMSSWSSTNLLRMFCTSSKMGAQPSWTRLFAHMPNILSGVTNLHLHFEFRKSEKSKDFPSRIPLICSAKVVNMTAEKAPSGKLPILQKDQKVQKITKSCEKHFLKELILQ